jgi:antitoxin component YwqK of YwqJK toxin-antitoxin module
MKLLPIVCLLFVANMFAQERCEFKYYAKKGGHYLFSTFFADNMQTPLDGVCQTISNGKTYEKRVFLKGRLLEEQLYFFDTHVLRSEFKLNENKKLNNIAYQKIYDEKGVLIQHSIFYYDNNNRRCEHVLEYFPNGQLRFDNYYAWVKKEELDPSEDKNYPPHTIDDEGYTYTKVPFGMHRSYYESGYLKEITTFKLFFMPHADEYARNGLYQLYHENGKLHTRGFYQNGHKDSTWLSYDYIGNLIEENFYRDNLKIGIWKGYHSNGKQKYEYIYDVNSKHPFEPAKTEWNEQGTKTLEVSIDSFGYGQRRIWSKDGVLIEQTDIFPNREINGVEKHWFENGQLKSIINNTPNADTTYVEYFENGKIAKLHLQLEAYGKKMKSNKEWNNTGILIVEMNQSSWEEQNQEFSHITYYDNGNMKYRIYQKNRERAEEFYHQNGIKIKYVQMLDGLVHGNYQTFDTLGNIRINFRYAFGLRNGICREYDEKNTLIFHQNYIHGCVDQKFANRIAPKIKKWETLMPPEKKDIYGFTYFLLNHYSKHDTLLYYTKSHVDSIALCIYWFKNAWNASDDFPITNQIEHPKITFTLPVPLFKGLEIRDTSNHYVRDLLLIFQKVGWKLPNSIKTDANRIVFSYEDDNFYTQEFFLKYFSWYFQQNFAYVQASKMNAVELPEAKYQRRSDYMSLYRNTGCTFFATYGNWQSSYRFVIYDDGSVESYNQQFSWEDIKPYASFDPMQWD